MKTVVFLSALAKRGAMELGGVEYKTEDAMELRLRTIDRLARNFSGSQTAELARMASKTEPWEVED